MDRFRALTVAGLLLVVSACNSTKTSSFTPNATPTPVPANGSIQHVILLVQENRSFNTMFMDYPGATTSRTGACIPLPHFKPHPLCLDGKPVRLKQVTLETTGNPFTARDIGHNHVTFEIEYDGGKMDGFDNIQAGTTGQSGPAGLYPYAFVEPSEIKPYWDMAKAYTLADMMFSTATTDSFVAHQQIIAGTTRLSPFESLVDTPSGIPWGCDTQPGTVTGIIKTNGTVLPEGGPFPCLTEYKTMADVLDAAHVSWKFYVDAELADFSGEVWNGFDAIAKVRCASFRPPEDCKGFGPDWKPHISEPNISIFGDLKKGTLPQVAWVIPTLADSDHPASASNTGPSWVASVVNAVGKSKYWRSTAIVVIWDDWGGWYDSVPPPQLTYTSLGMRVPMLVISPWTKHGTVSHTQYDFGSILKYVEQNFGTASLGTSDVDANSIGDVFDFTQSLKPFKPISAQYKTEYFLRPRAFPSAQQIIQADGGAPD